MHGKALIVAVVSMALSAGARAGTEGSSSTFYGQDAGAAANPASGSNTFLGVSAGAVANAGGSNTFVGRFSGRTMTSGQSNTFLGSGAGGGMLMGSYNTAVGASSGGSQIGDRNVFLGFGAGFSDPGTNKLYIDNCQLSGALTCDLPLIYGEFDNRILAVDGVMHVTANRDDAAVRSQLHFSVTGADEGGWLTSAGANNFFTSSGARYDADAGGWIQRSADGKAVIAGSGAAGFRVLTSSGGAVGSAVAPVSRLHIDYNGLMGVNVAPAAGRAINTSTGAYLSSGGAWVNASSRDLKEDIEELSPEAALRALRDLRPVTYRYKAEPGATHAGFIAEDAPALVATADRKGLSALDIVAVLTQVVKEKTRQIERQEAEIAAHSARFAAMEARFEALAAESRRERR